MLFTTPALTDDDSAVLAAIDRHRTDLRYNLAAPHRWVGTLARQQRARDILGSNSIEGIHVSRDEALAMAVEQEELVEVDDDWLAVKGYSDAMTYARVMAEGGRTMSLPDLLALHFMVTSHDLSKRPGRLRESEVYVQEQDTGNTVYTGPDAQDVPGLVNELLESIAEQAAAHPFVVAAMAHLNLVMIHPFSDGNGRLSRILQSWCLYRHDVSDAEFVSVEEHLGRNTQSYYDVLAGVGAGRWSPQRDAGPWLEFMLTAHYRQAMTIRRRIRELEQIAVLVDELIAANGLPERSAAALEFCFTGWRLTNAHYRESSDVNANTASRDLGAAVRAGVLDRRGDKRGASYVPAENLQNELATIRRTAADEFDPSLDPYRTLRRGGSF